MSVIIRIMFVLCVVAATYMASVLITVCHYVTAPLFRVVFTIYMTIFCAAIAVAIKLFRQMK